MAINHRNRRWPSNRLRVNRKKSCSTYSRSRRRMESRYWVSNTKWQIPWWILGSTLKDFILQVDKSKAFRTWKEEIIGPVIIWIQLNSLIIQRRLIWIQPQLKMNHRGILVIFCKVGCSGLNKHLMHLIIPQGSFLQGGISWCSVRVINVTKMLNPWPNLNLRSEKLRHQLQVIIYK